MSRVQIVIAVAVVVVIVAAFYVLTKPSTKSVYEAAKESLPYEVAPIRHDELPPELVDRISELQAVFSEVYPITREEWLDGFQRDLSPEREVAIWERMARVYTQALDDHDLYANARNEAFQLLLVRSTTDDLELQISELRYLTADQAKEIVDLYEAAPEPVIVGDA